MADSLRFNPVRHQALRCLHSAWVHRVQPVGTVEGESFYETTTQRGFIWDGSTWRDVTPSAILRYPNDAALVADQTQGVGAYGVSGTTGNLYVYTTTGWRPIGTQEYPTIAGLLADTPAIGTLAIAMDEGSEWEYLSTGWNCTSLRHLPTTADVLAWTDPGNSHLGDRALAADKEVQYIRTSGGWKPASPYEDTEANIRADVTWPMAGQEAISTDTGQIFVFVGGQWMEDPIQHYPTEQDLLAATPPVGTVAFADDNGLFYGRTSGGWRRANSPTSSVGAHPANPADGDLNFRPSRGLQVYAGSSWEPVGGTPPGTIIMYPSWTSPPGYILCDGRALPATATEAIALVGANTPDLRGQFIRGAHSGHNPLVKETWQTARPRNNFTGGTNQQGLHDHEARVSTNRQNAAWYHDRSPGFISFNSGGETWAAPSDGQMFSHHGGTSSDSGAHTHTVTITGGGDAETRPDNVRLAFHMKL